MKPLTKDEIDVIQQRLVLFATFCLDDELSGLLERYLEQTHAHREGSTDAMSIADATKAQADRGYLCGVAGKILEVSSLTKAHLRLAVDRTGKAN